MLNIFAFSAYPMSILFFLTSIVDISCEYYIVFLLYFVVMYAIKLYICMSNLPLMPYELMKQHWQMLHPPAKGHFVKELQTQRNHIIHCLQNHVISSSYCPLLLCAISSVLLNLQHSGLSNNGKDESKWFNLIQHMPFLLLMLVKDLQCLRLNSIIWVHG